MHEQLGRVVGAPHDEGFGNVGWPRVVEARDALESLGIGYGKQGTGAGRFHAYAGDPIARSVGTPVSHIRPL